MINDNALNKHCEKGVFPDVDMRYTIGVDESKCRLREEYDGKEVKEKKAPAAKKAKPAKTVVTKKIKPKELKTENNDGKEDGKSSE